jgi:hypothetical protein
LVSIIVGTLIERALIGVIVTIKGMFPLMFPLLKPSSIGLIFAPVFAMLMFFPFMAEETAQCYRKIRRLAISNIIILRGR